MVSHAGPLHIYFNSFIDTNSSKIEYAIQPETDAPPVWQTTTPLRPAIILQPKAGSTYRLLLRYSFQPETQQEYTIAVEPYWLKKPASIAGLFIVVTMAATGAIVYRHRRKTAATLQKQSEALEKQLFQLQLIRLQLNPHFIFNALSSIQGLMNAGNTRSANTYLSEFGKLMRNTLDMSEHLYSSLSQEVALLDSYLKLEQLRFGFEYTWQVDANVDMERTEMPALLLQPLVENAVKHGVSVLKKAGMIVIKIERQEKDLFITVIDNGKGMNELTPHGHGLSLTQKRIGLFNQMLKEDKIQKACFYKDEATHVQLSFKNWLT